MTYTDMNEWNREQKEFLAKIGQVEAPTKPTAKKEEDK
jgi:hypothetical protein